MSRARAALQARREQLIARSDLHREEIAREAEALRKYFIATDVALSVVTFLRGGTFKPSSRFDVHALGRLPVPGLRWLLHANRVWYWVRRLFAFPF